MSGMSSPNAARPHRYRTRLAPRRRRRGPGAGDARHHRNRADHGCEEACRDRLRPYRRRALSWRFRHAVRRAAGRARGQGRCADDAQCRRARSRLRHENAPPPARARDGGADDAGLRGDGLRPELDLCALSGRAPASLGERCRLGRIQCRRLLQFGARRPHQPLWRFSRYLLRDHCTGALLRPAYPREPARDLRARLLETLTCPAQRRGILASDRHPLRPARRNGYRRTV